MIKNIQHVEKLQDKIGRHVNYPRCQNLDIAIFKNIGLDLGLKCYKQ